MEKITPLIIVEPQPYQRVEASFLVFGFVQLKYLKWGEDFSRSLSLEILDVTGKTISGRSVSVNLPENKEDLNQMVFFAFRQAFSEFSVGWLVKSQGRMAINLSTPRDSTDGSRCEIFFPFIVSKFEPEIGCNSETIKKHETIEQRVLRYREDDIKYREELNRLYDDREAFYKASIRSVEAGFGEIDGNFADEIFYMIDSDGDDERRKLDEKFKDMLEWSGPYCGACIGRLNGFEFKVYSNDHGKHFHVIHKDRRINARFSFPEIELMSYKQSKNIIDSKTHKHIQEFFKNPNNFKRLEIELLKQESARN